MPRTDVTSAIGPVPGEELADSADASTIPGAYLVFSGHYEELAQHVHLLRWYLSWKDRDHAGRALDAKGLNQAQSIEVGGIIYDVEPGWSPTGSSVYLRRDGQVVAWHRFDRERLPKLDQQQLYVSEDADGDGLMDLVLRGEKQIAILKWEPAAWETSESGWRSRADHQFGYGSAALTDWNNDGQRELMVGEYAADDGVHAGSKSLLLIDLDNGRIRTGLPLVGGTWSTPQLSTNSDGRLNSAYIDTLSVQEGWAALTRFEAGVSAGPGTRRVVDSAHELTWPVFQDVNGDGTKEVLIGAMRDTDAAVLCFDKGLEGPLLWSWTQGDEGRPTSYLSYPLLTDRDLDGVDELCLTIGGRFICLQTQLKVDRKSRVMWVVQLDPDARSSHQAGELGDLDGDGFTELALVTTTGHMYILSRAQNDGVLRQMQLPYRKALPTGFDPSTDEYPEFVYTRLALVDAHIPEQRCLVSATADGFVYCMDPLSGKLRWSYELGGRIIASPLVIEGGKEHRSRVVVAGENRWLVVLEPQAVEDSDTPAVVWSFVAQASIGSTPVYEMRKGQGRLYFTDYLGHIYGLPIPAATRR